MIFGVIFATIVLLLLAAFLMFFFVRYRVKNNDYIKEREAMQKSFDQTLLQSQVEVQEATFAGLAKELHDNVGQLLSSTKMLLGITQRNLGNSPDTLTIAEETLGKAISELRSLSKSLDKEWLEQFDFIHNLEVESSRINDAKHLRISFTHPGKLALRPEEQIILFRIVQEAMQNAMKHADPDHIQIHLTVAEEKMRVIVIDNGHGFNETHQKEGMGIRNMKHRTKLLGGKINWNSTGNGSSVIIELPNNQQPI
jgi:signal transduction histidine kinase